MTTTETVLISLMPALLILSAVFSGTETALFGLTAEEERRIRRTRPGVARSVAALQADPRMLLITILLGNMVTNVLFFVIASVLALRAEDVALRTVWSVAPLVAIILLGEVTPKIIAAADRVRWCGVLAAPVLILHRAIAPLRSIINTLLVTPAARLTAVAEAPPLTADELGALLNSSARHGEIDPAEAEILDDIVEIGALRVCDVMTPRVDLRWIDVGADGAAVRAVVHESGVSRIPVCRRTIDDGVVGVLDAPTALARLSVEPAASARDLMGPVLFVPEQARLDQVLEQFRDRRRLLAIAVDEHGAVAGLITFHDIAARVGRSLESVESGFGAPAQPSIERLEERVWRVPGRLSVSDLVSAFGPATGRVPGTVAGLIHSRLNRIARPGDRVRLGPIELVVETMRGRAIESVVVRLAPGDGHDAGHQS